MTSHTAQNPAIISHADLADIRASLSIAKDGRSFRVLDAEGNILATKSKKAGAEQFVQNYIPEFSILASDLAPEANPEAPASTPTETPEMTEPTDTPTDLPVIHATLDVTDIVGDTVSPAPTEGEAPEPAPLSEEEQAAADKAAQRSQKLRDAMAKVLDAVKAGEYDPNKSHPSLRTKKGLLLQLEGQDEPTDLPAVLHHRAISSFSDKSLVDGVMLGDRHVAAARTRGTWGGIKTSFLWIEAPATDFPPSMVGATSRATVTFHILIDNDDWDNLEGACVSIPANAYEAPAPKVVAAKSADKPTPTDDTPTPAEREHAQA
jgi:hypothetical protein